MMDDIYSTRYSSRVFAPLNTIVLLPTLEEVQNTVSNMVLGKMKEIIHPAIQLLPNTYHSLSQEMGVNKDHNELSHVVEIITGVIPNTGGVLIDLHGFTDLVENHRDNKQTDFNIVSTIELSADLTFNSEDGEKAKEFYDKFIDKNKNEFFDKEYHPGLNICANKIKMPFEVKGSAKPDYDLFSSFENPNHKGNFTYCILNTRTGPFLNITGIISASYEGLKTEENEPFNTIEIIAPRETERVIRENKIKVDESDKSMYYYTGPPRWYFKLYNVVEK
ncbi:MAG: hypothetical protein ACP5N3_06055 [Candidatus Nanoarchaeia archaeon]